MSLSVDVEDDGVRTGDWLESRDEGDAVPSLESLFFLDDLLESFPRERTLWLKRFILSDNSVTVGGGRIETPATRLEEGGGAGGQRRQGLEETT